MTLTFLDVIRYPLFLQRFLCLSPFRRCRNDPQRLVTSVGITLYSWMYIVTYVLLVIVAVLMIRAGTIDWQSAPFRQGYLWLIIAGFELSFTFVTHPLLLLFALIKRDTQISMMMHINSLDERIRRTFDWSFDAFYTSKIRIQTLQMCVWFIYFAVLHGCQMAMMFTHGFSSAGFQLLMTMYQIEQSTTGLLSWSTTNTLKMMTSKFKTLRLVHAQMTMRTVLVSGMTTMTTNGGVDFDGGQFHQQRDDALRMKRQLASLMKMFKELCDMIDTLNDHMGAQMVLRYAHDFTMLVSQCYLIYCVVLENGWQLDAQMWALVATTMLWMMQNVLRIGLTAMWAATTVHEVGPVSSHCPQIIHLFALSHENTQAYHCGYNIVNTTCSPVDKDTQHMASCAHHYDIHIVIIDKDLPFP